MTLPEDKIVGRDRLGRPIWKRYFLSDDGKPIARCVLDAPSGEVFCGPGAPAADYICPQVGPAHMASGPSNLFPESEALDAEIRAEMEKMLRADGWLPEHWREWALHSWRERVDGGEGACRVLSYIVDTGAVLEKYATVKVDA